MDIKVEKSPHPILPPIEQQEHGATVMSPEFFMEVTRLFNQAPLPYKYVYVPGVHEPRAPPHLYYYINRVITNLTRDAFRHAGFKETKNETVFNASWGRQYDPPEYSRCKSWQKINHFCGAFLMGRKDHLDTRMKELAKIAPDLANFYPKSYLLPPEKESFNQAWKQRRLWIFKPSASSRGRGIVLVDSSNPSSYSEFKFKDFEGVAQTYIERPFLITNRKFDIRLYCLITGIAPLRIYMHTAGLARFCAHPYDPNSLDENSNLTNYSLNKDDAAFVSSDGTKETVRDSKWTLNLFLSFLKNQRNIDIDQLMKELERVLICTVISGMNAIRIKHEMHIHHRHTSYELYGIDIMLDDRMMPHLIEINISPSMSGMDSRLDYNMKFPIMLDLLRMARIIDCNCSSPNPCPGIDAIDKEFSASKRLNNRVAQVENGSLNPWDSPVFADYTIIRDFIEEMGLKRSRVEESATMNDYFDSDDQFLKPLNSQPVSDDDFRVPPVAEVADKSHFRLVFPVPETMDIYGKAFNKWRYEDIVLRNWMAMNETHKMQALRRGFENYQNRLAEITGN